MSGDTFELLWRELVAQLGAPSPGYGHKGPYIENDYGYVFCYFCAADAGKPHADDCIYARALALLAEQMT